MDCPAQFAVDEGARFDGRALLVDVVQSVVHLGKRDFGEKSEGAQVDAENRHTGAGHDAGGREQCAVAAEHNDKIEWACAHLLAVDDLRA